MSEVSPLWAMRDSAMGGYDRGMKAAERDRSFLVDAAMAIVLFVSSLLSMVGLPEIEGVQSVDVFTFVLIATATLPLAWRRRLPVSVVVVALASFMTYVAIGYPPSWALFGLSFALYSVGTELPFDRSRIIGGGVIAIATLWAFVGVFVESVPWTGVLGTLLFFTFPWLLGLEARRRSQRAKDLEARAVKAEMLHAQEEIEAVRVERARIARELHDAVAHEMTVMTIHAAAAERAITTDPQAAERSLGIVQDAGRRGLTEMRRLLGLLREGGDAEAAPQPGMDSVPALVAQMADAGLQVVLEVDGEPTELSAGVDLSAYRIVQESLTNVIRHAGPDVHAVVHLTYTPDALEITVADNGRGASEGLGAEQSGHGLVGMEERAALLGGSMVAGPRAGGGYHVHATIPMAT